MMMDLRFTLRTLCKTPGFTAVAVLVLGLGIGASTTNFSLVNALLLRPLPLIKDQQRLVSISEYFDKAPHHNTGISLPDYMEWKTRATSFDGMGAYKDSPAILSDISKVERYVGAQISADIFPFMGVEPILGRQLRPEEEEVGAPPVALIGYNIWQNHFAADPTIIGKTVRLNGAQVPIVGVMPKGWRFPGVCDIWTPLTRDVRLFGRGDFSLKGIAKLKPGISIMQAKAELQSIAANIAAAHPETNEGISVHLQRLREQMVQNVKALTVLLMGAVLFVQLIGAANVANLLLARGASRAREFGIRLALGARRRQIVRQLLLESIFLGLAGSATGLLFSVWGIYLMVGAVPAEIPYWIRFDIDWRILAFALGIGVTSSIFFGLLPAIRTVRHELLELLREGGGGMSGIRVPHRLRGVLIVAEIALALVLLVGAGLMMRSFLKLQDIDIGADPSNTLVFRIDLPPSQFPDDNATGSFFEELVSRLQTLPGVEAAGATSALPAAGNIDVGALVLEGEPEPKQLQEARPTCVLFTTPGFLSACHIHLVHGRDFTVADMPDALPVAIIDEDAAQRWFPNQEPLGHQLRALGRRGEPPRWATIVGVVRHVAYNRLTNSLPYPVVYFSQRQNPQRSLSVAVRTVNPKALMGPVSSVVQALRKDVPIYRVQTMDEVFAQSFWDRRFFGSLFSVFALLALFLASVGVYGVIAYIVRQRTREIGLRIALGARPGDVFRLITGQGVRLILLGLGLGSIGSFFLTKVLASSLYGVSVHDPFSFIVVPAVLFAVGLLACYLPARSAMRLNPVEALRHD